MKLVKAKYIVKELKKRGIVLKNPSPRISFIRDDLGIRVIEKEGNAFLYKIEDAEQIINEIQKRRFNVGNPNFKIKKSQNDLEIQIALLKEQNELLKEYLKKRKKFSFFK